MTALRRFWDSMTGRIFILLVLSISVSVSLSLALADARQDAAIDRARMGILASRATDFIQLLSRAPPEVRERLMLEGLPGLRMATPDMQAGAIDRDLTAFFAGQLPDYAHPVARIADPNLCLMVLSADGPREDPAAGIRRNFTDLDCWLVTAHTADGRPLVLRFNLPHQLDTSPFADPIPLALSFLAFSVIAFVIARMAAKPLKQLASAAAALGDDLDRSPLQEGGTSEVRAAARAFNAMQELLRRQMKQRRQMLGAITHDLQTPLTRLRLRIEKVDDDALRQRLVADLAQMQSLIREGLEFARGDETSEPTAVLHVDSLLQSLAQDAADAGHPVSFVGGCRCDLTAQPQALRRTVANLLDNAIKYAGSAELGAEAGPEGLKIWVRDHGPGLPEDRLADVLEPFVRLENSRSRETGGTGLGLAIANMLTQKNGATLTLRNHPDGGLEASLAFPPSAVGAPRRAARARGATREPREVAREMLGAESPD